MTFSIHKSFPIYLLSFFLFIRISSCLRWDGNILYDLEATGFSGFNTEAAAWTLSEYNTPGVKFSSCNGEYVMGGYNVLGGITGRGPSVEQYFQRTYSSLPTHNQIYIQLKFYQIDTWNLGEGDYFSIGVDYVKIDGWELDDRYPGIIPLCGHNEFKDFAFKISLARYHTSSSLTLQMISYTDEETSNESFGFRDIKIEFLTNTSPYNSICAPDVPSSYLSAIRCQTSCTSPGNTIQPYPGYGFCFPSSSCSANCRRCSDTPTTCTWCHTGWFLIGQTCYSSCDSPLQTEILGGVTYCKTPCSSLSQYAWWAGSCSSSCSYTTSYGSYAVVGTTNNTFKICNYPCATTDFLYWNTSCLSSCPSPLRTTIYRSRNFCEHPCGSSDYLYWNGSCLSTCPPPLSAEIQGTTNQRRFCWYSCQPGEYLYWNGSCLSTCPSPLSPETQGTTDQRNFCWYSCQTSDHLYWNGSCIQNCPSPLTSEVQGTIDPRNFCWYSCQPGEFLYWNGSCLSTCPSPLSPETQGTSNQRKFCWYSCQPADYLYWNGSCLSACPSPLSAEIQGTIDSRNFCWYSCQPGEYLYWNSSCINSCPSPLTSEIQGTTDQRNFCWYSCQPAEYLYWNGSCVNSCPSPLTSEIQGTIDPRNFCWYSCQPSEYLYWNGSCLNTCPSPLTSETPGTNQPRNFCWYSCQPAEHLYWNGSCVNSCPSPLTSEIQGTIDPRNFCWYSCQPDKHLYWNGSCINSCPSPLTSEIQGTIDQRNFCWHMCSETDYLYWNGSCINTCPLPLNSELQGVTDQKHFCWYPCQPGEYLYWNGSCVNSCPSPLSLETQGTTDQRKFCWYACQPAEYLYWNGSCIQSCPAPLTSEIQGTMNLRNFCWYSCQPGEYMYWNGSCLSTCPSPLSPETQGTTDQRNFCWYSCQPAEYLYWNGSCIQNCPSPLISEIQGTIDPRNFCWYTCQPGEYLYWNSSCINSCPSPLTSEIQGTTDQRNFCWYSCQPAEYLYWNGSCVNSCPSPLTSEIQGTIDPRNFCWYFCQPSEYLYWNGSCLSTCPSPLTSETPGTNQPRNFCWYSCQPAEYLYWNGSCVNSCPSPLTSEVQGTIDPRNFCWYSCQPDEHLYWNGSCVNSCPSPLTSETPGTNQPRNFCWYSCQPADYLYWNGSCINACPLPLNSEIQGVTDQRHFCWYPCQPDEFLYWNGSCLSSCPPPLTPEAQGPRNFCWSLCQPHEYLSWNGSCLSKCPLPLMIVNDPGVSYCFLPCDNPNIYWYKNNTCLPSCDYPYNIIPYSQVLQCLSPCPDSKYFYDLEKKCHSQCNYPYIEQTIDVVKICDFGVSITREEADELLSKADAIKTQGKYTSGSMKAASLLSSGNPAFALLAGLSAMLQYIRYMRINYPPRVEVFFKVSAVDPISLYLNFEIPNFFEDKLIDHPLPYVFEKYDINSNFVNNLWDFLMTLAVSLLVIVVFVLLDFISRRFSKINKLMAKIVKVLKWNTPLAMICSSSGDIFFYSSLQFQSSPLDSTASIVCFVVCLFMITSVTALFASILAILRSFKLSRQRDPLKKEDWKEKWSSWEILFVEYEEKSLFSLGYLALFILRGMVFNLTIANLYNFPLLQAIIITIANFLMYGYLLYFRPLKELLGIAQLFVTEGIVFIVTVCVLMLAIMDAAHKDGQSTRVGVGDVIVFMIQAFNILALAFMAISLLLFFISTYKIWRVLRARGIKSPIKILEMIFFEDFEAEMAAEAKGKPKIHQFPSKEMAGNSSVNVRDFETGSDNLSVERSLQLSGENLLPNSLLRLQLQQAPEDGLAITDLDSIPRLFEQDLKESPELRFCGLDKTMIEEIKNLDENILEKKISSLGNAESMERAAPSTSVDMFEDLRKLKTRMNKFGNIDFQKQEKKEWFDNLRKLKSKLKRHPNNPGITLENPSSNLE